MAFTSTRWSALLTQEEKRNDTEEDEVSMEEFKEALHDITLAHNTSVHHDTEETPLALFLWSQSQDLATARC